ncbi:hypothetical protein QFZ82_007116 [Streptomyces sp. V4I23]|uniref:hypothetical protein n=1 Tax=Streptomyces sp. V4I23 TaxID=3042282 RepID=UPI00277D438E|nr:hypothetical protein [Streptomyces sp. V4I23]MDQ1012631.1 hypothetical protein [Streptomyces sp. V4I23]
MGSDLEECLDEWDRGHCGRHDLGAEVHDDEVESGRDEQALAVSNVPFAAHRRKRVERAAHGPYRSVTRRETVGLQRRVKRTKVEQQ